MDIQGFLYWKLHFSAFSIFYDCRLVGAGCRQVHVARRSRWLVFNEGGAAGSRQASRQASRLGRRSRYQILSAISRQSQPAARYFNVKQGGLERGNWIVLKVAGKTSSRTTIKDVQRKGWSGRGTNDMNHTKVSGLKLPDIFKIYMILLVVRSSGWMVGWIDVWMEWIDGPPFLLCPALVWLVCRAPVPDIPISAFQTFISTLALSQIGPEPA